MNNSEKPFPYCMPTVTGVMNTCHFAGLKQQKKRSERTMWVAPRRLPTTPRRWAKFFSTKIKNNDDNSPRVLVDDSSTSTDGIVVVTLNRPHKRNALDMPMFDALQQTARELKDCDSSVRAILLRGAGQDFCSGLDFKSVVTNAQGPGNIRRLLERPKPATSSSSDNDDDNNNNPNLAQEICTAWREIPVPVIACLHGTVMGGGLQLALGADLRLASPNARLSLRESAWGLVPDMGATIFLRELGVGIDRAKSLIWSAQGISAQQAYEWGIVTQVVPGDKAESKSSSSDDTNANDNDDDTVTAAARAWVQEFVVPKSPTAIAVSKRLLHQTYDHDVSVPQALLYESRAQEQLMTEWNTLAAAGRNMTGWKLPYTGPPKK